MSQLNRIIDATEIGKIARYLSKSPAKQAIFEWIYRGGNKPKTVKELTEKTKLSETRVAQIATPMAHRGYVIMHKEQAKVSYSKYADLVSRRDEILRLSRNLPKLKAIDDAKLGKVNVTVHVKTNSRPSIRVEPITVDAIDNFKRVRRVSPSKTKGLKPKRLRESVFKYGLAKILGDQGTFTDWGGEKNDLYSDFLMIGGKRYRSAIALKGIATSGPLTIAKLGKNADQIPRLFTSAAEVFLVQYEGQITEAVIDLMETCAIRKSKETGKVIRFGTISAEDSARLRIAYSAFFVN